MSKKNKVGNSAASYTSISGREVGVISITMGPNDSKMARPIAEQVDGLEKEVITLHEVVSLLESKLEDFLVPSEPLAVAAAIESKFSGSPLAERISKISSGAEKLRERIGSICDRIHV
ncbi:MAG: hypothetical protein IT581_06530 [Verrucomicrobiales bacterium]|nr:hypothetical protein [Verrucomicrobiales bacterium]